MSTPDNDMQSPGLNPYMEHVRTISGAFEDMLPLVLRAFCNLETLRPFVESHADRLALARFNELASDITRLSGGLHDVWATERSLVGMLLATDPDSADEP